MVEIPFDDLSLLRRNLVDVKHVFFDAKVGNKPVEGVILAQLANRFWCRSTSLAVGVPEVNLRKPLFPQILLPSFNRLIFPQYHLQVSKHPIQS